MREDGPAPRIAPSRAEAAPGPSPEVVTLGETMVLFWPAEDSDLETAVRYQRSFGGAESNLAIALSRLGHRVRWISRLGNDPFGGCIRTSLEREGVEVLAASDPDAPTAVFFKGRNLATGRRVVYYRAGSAASRLSPAEIPGDAFEGARVVHLTGITPALSTSCAATVDHAFEQAKIAGCLISFDPNIRLQIWPDEETCRQTLLPLLSLADLVLLGDEDAAVLFPGQSEEAVLDEILSRGARAAVLKRGHRGAIAAGVEGRQEIEAIRVSVIDTVGAGDGFNAGYLAASLRRLPVRERLRWGAYIGACAVSVRGDWEGYPGASALLAALSP